MIIAVNRLRVPEGVGGRLEEGFRHASGMRDVPGCAGFELWRGEDGTEYQAVTRWRARADFDNWRQSEAFRHAHRDTRGMSHVESELVVFEVALGAPDGES